MSEITERVQDDCKELRLFIGQAGIGGVWAASIRADLLQRLERVASLAAKVRELTEFQDKVCQLVDEADPQAPNLNQWTCFHCGETFTTVGSARDHFGATPDAVAGCLVDRVALEEGGKPERGRGLLMALRKAEGEVASLAAKVQQLEDQIQELQARGGKQAAVGHLQSAASQNKLSSERQ